MPNHRSEIGYHRHASGCEQGAHDLFSIALFMVLPVWAIVSLFKALFVRKSTFSSSEIEAFKHAEQVKKDLAEVQKMIGPSKPDYSVTIGASVPKTPPPGSSS